MFIYLLLIFLTTLLPIKLLWNYFSNPINSLPGPKFYEITPYDFMKYPSDLIYEWIQKYGMTFCWKLIGNKSFIVTIDPKIIKLVFSQEYKNTQKMDVGLKNITGGHGLLANENYHNYPEHDFQRKLFKCKLTKKEIRDSIPEYQMIIEKLITKWNNEINKSENKQITIDLKYEFTRLTLEVLCELLLDYDINSINNEFIANDLYDTLTKYFKTFNNYTILGYQYIGSGIKYLPIKNNYDYWTSRHKLSNLISSIMLNHMKNNNKTNKLIDLIMNSELSNIEIFDNILTFLLAGHETTASCLSWTLYELCLNPDYIKNINDKKFMNNIINESLRLHPPVPLIARKVLKDFYVNDINIPSDTNIIISILGSHLRSDYWENPLLFNPNRWNNIKINPYIYMPFLSGPRSCIGKEFALKEIELALNSLLTEFNFELSKNSKVVNKVDFTSKPDQLIVNITKRV